ncbi:polysaccharide deacetylase family protein [Brevundimonas sp. 2R-24]|uniref:Chitooligosaccharide deacetylase n=1 Tax=Peiella sedimenti TaxID=3061083 RepID=A0ABT8SP33_9CAUL|nr:polysaccharide deacetylase family protein [Caulobacteraceae bacterium XZ-24]
MQAYAADRSLKGKLRRRLARLQARRPLDAEIPGPIVSFSFDDIPESAASVGAPVLENLGVRGSFYVCAGLDGRAGPMGPHATRAQIAELAARGHEIGCHTFEHLDCGKAGREAIDASVAANSQALNGMDVRTFAYPYGEVSVTAKLALADHFQAVRALHPGLIRRGADLNQLPCVGIEGDAGEARAAAWIDRAASGRAWLILYSHDVSARPSRWGCTPEALARLVHRAKDAGAEVLPVADALARIRSAR